MIGRLPSWTDRTAVVWLVLGWFGSVLALACVVVGMTMPVDMKFDWLSAYGLEIVGLVTAIWLVPGLVLGGWKALLVAAGESTVQTLTDRAMICIFTFWVIVWPAAVIIDAVRIGVV